MSKRKTPESEPSAPPKGAVSLGEIEHRLTVLESAVAEIRKSHLENHKWFITIVFSLVGILLIHTTNQSADQVAQAIRDMKNDVAESTRAQGVKVDRETSELERKFTEFSGEALKKPILEITCGTAPLDGQTFMVSPNIAVPFYPIFIKNIGDKRTEPLSIQISTTYQLFQNGSLDWIRTETSDKDLPFCYASGVANVDVAAEKGIAPQQTWALDGDRNQQIFTGISGAMSGQVKCLLTVYYGSEKPAEAKFTMKFK